MICDFFKLFNWSNVSANDSLLFFVNSYRSEDLSVHKLFVIKVSECSGQLSLILLVENYLAGPGIIIDFKNDSHLFIILRNDSANHDNLKNISQLILLTSLICWPSISSVSSGLTGASVSIWRVTGVKTWFFLCYYCWPPWLPPRKLLLLPP